MLRAIAALAAVWLAVASFGETAAAQDKLSAQAVGAKIAERYGVTVLDVAEVDDNGQPAYEVKVMNPSGNFNEAFQVNTLLVDAGTGELKSVYRHGPTGANRSAGVRRDSAGEMDGEGVRRRSFRQ